MEFQGCSLFSFIPSILKRRLQSPPRSEWHREMCQFRYPKAWFNPDLFPKKLEKTFHVLLSSLKVTKGHTGVLQPSFSKGHTLAYLSKCSQILISRKQTLSNSNTRHHARHSFLPIYPSLFFLSTVCPWTTLHENIKSRHSPCKFGKLSSVFSHVYNQDQDMSQLWSRQEKQNESWKEKGQCGLLFHPLYLALSRFLSFIL